MPPSFQTLLEVSKHGDNCYNEARSSFKLKYAESKFVFHPYYLSNTEIEEKDEIFTITSQIFGDLITDISMDTLNAVVDNCKVPDYHARVVLEAIYQKCTKSLERIEFVLDEVNYFTFLPNSFESINYLNLTLNIQVELHESKIFNRIFPNLESLEIPSINAESWSYVYGKFQHLKTLKFAHLNFKQHGKMIIEMIKLNKQIKHLEVENPSPLELEEIGKIARLDKFSIRSMPIENSIDLAHVKDFTVETLDNYQPNF